jgi:hypothetical protein
MFSLHLRFWLCVLLLALGRLTGNAVDTTNQPPPNYLVTLGWNPSPDTNAVGYLILWGTSSGAYTNQMDVGSTNSATVTGLATNVIYYFCVAAYDATGQESAPSNEIATTPWNPAVAPTLSLGPQSTGSTNAGLCLSFQGYAGNTYVIQASQDLQHWEALSTTNCVSDGLIIFADTDMTNYPCRFYRVKQ